MSKINILNIVKRDGDEKKDDYYTEMVKIRDSCYTSNRTKVNFFFDSPDIIIDDDTMYCPVNFDGRLCWDAIPAGATALQQCPEYLVGPGVDKNVTKKCLQDGFWYTKDEERRPWASYLECFSPDAEEFDTLVKDILFTGIVTALIYLTMTALLLITFRLIKHLEVKFHYRFLGALALDNFFFVAWYNKVVMNSEVRLDQMVLARPDIVSKWLCVAGWLTTALLVAVRAAGRNNEGRKYPLWMVPSGKHWMYTMPIVIAMYLAFFSLIHFITEVAAEHIGSPNDSYIVEFLHVMKAPLVLIPICGVHFLLVPFNPPETNVLYKYFQMFKSMVFSLLGACISFLLYNSLTIAMRYRMTRYRRFYYLEGVFDCGVPEREHIN